MLDSLEDREATFAVLKHYTDVVHIQAVRVRFSTSVACSVTLPEVIFVCCWTSAELVHALSGARLLENYQSWAAWLQVRSAIVLIT